MDSQTYPPRLGWIGMILRGGIRKLCTILIKDFKINDRRNTNIKAQSD